MRKLAIVLALLVARCAQLWSRQLASLPVPLPHNKPLPPIVMIPVYLT